MTLLSICCTKPLVEQTKAHIIIRFLFRFFFLLFLLLLFLGFLSSSTATSCSTTTNSWGSSNVTDKITMFLPSRALANKLGQKGSKSTLAAFITVVSFSAVTATSSWPRGTSAGRSLRLPEQSELHRSTGLCL